jgi:hypothetical protein
MAHKKTITASPSSNQKFTGSEVTTDRHDKWLSRRQTNCDMKLEVAICDIKLSYSVLRQLKGKIKNEQLGTGFF